MEGVGKGAMDAEAFDDRDSIETIANCFGCLTLYQVAKVTLGVHVIQSCTPESPPGILRGVTVR